MSTLQTAQPPDTSDRLETREYVGYALGDTASNFFFQSFNIFLTYYYVQVWGISLEAIMLMMLLVRLVGCVDDPIMGLIADRTKTRWGKYRPYLFWGAIPYGICGYLLFAGPELSHAGKIVYAYITYTLMLTSYSVINVPYSSMLGVISPSPRTRAVASSFRFVGAFTGALLITLFVWPLVKYLGGVDPAEPVQKIVDPATKAKYVLGFRWTMAIFAVASVFMFWITAATTRERVTPPPGQKANVREEFRELARNWPWIMIFVASIFSTTFVALRSGTTLFYFQSVVGDNSPVFIIKHLGIVFDRTTVFLTTGSIGLVVGTACLGSIVRRIDKKHCAAALSAITGICFGAFYFLPADWYWTMIALNMLAQFCAGPTSALTWALYGDVADYGEWKFGRRSTGLIYSASLFALKSGMTIGGFVLPMFLALYGFDQEASKQTSSAVLGITLAFSVMPGILGLLKAATIMVYPLNQKRVDEIERELAARRAATETVPA